MSRSPRLPYLSFALSALLTTAGCATTGQSSAANAPQDRPSPQAERDELRSQLELERAHVAGLRRELETEQADAATARAKASRLNESYDKLTRDYDQLKKALDERLKKPVERPDTSAAVLPDELDATLATWAAQYGERVTYQRGRGAVAFGNDGLFHPGSDVVKVEAQQPLQTLAAVLAQTPPDEYDIIVVGHTDDAVIKKEETLAKHPTNWHLSVHRAIAVQAVLVKAGLPIARTAVMGYAEYRPLGSDNALNRRVEIFLVRKGAVQPLEPVRRQPK